MNTTLLLQWLELPPGNWPPDHRVLLGLTAESRVDANLVELRALEQMEKLRPHQIMHPDLVTEGMTRLAQAMIALSETPVPTRAPAAIKPASAKPVREPLPMRSPVADALEAEPILPPKISPPRSDPAAGLILDAGRIAPSKVKPAAVANLPGNPAPVILDAEIVEAPKAPKVNAPRALVPTARLSSILQEEAGNREAASPRPVAIPLGLPATAPEGLIYLPKDRRDAYSELVSTRRMIESWNELKPFLGNPSEEFQSPVQVLEFLRAVQKCRSAVAKFSTAAIFENRQRGIVAMIQHPLALTLFRELLPAQRKDLAISWSLGSQLLQRHYENLRVALNESKPRRHLPQALSRGARWFRDTPEWWLGGIIILSLAIAIYRLASGRSS